MEVLMVVYVTLLIPSFFASVVGIFFDLVFIWTTIAIPPVAFLTVFIGVFVFAKQSKIAYLLWLTMFAGSTAGLFRLGIDGPQPLLIAAFAQAVVTTVVLIAIIYNLPHWIRVYRGTD